jgi:hypothetical protein
MVRPRPARLDRPLPPRLAQAIGDRRNHVSTRGLAPFFQGPVPVFNLM